MTINEKNYFQSTKDEFEEQLHRSLTEKEEEFLRWLEAMVNKR